MNSSVFHEEVSKALIDHIRKYIKIIRNDGTSESVPVRVRKPDEDFKKEDYPCITIYGLYSSKDNLRYDPRKIVVEIQKDKGTAIIEDSAIPFNLTYQIDFWSRLQTDMDHMQESWILNHPEISFLLEVVDRSGNIRYSNCILKDSFKKTDFLNDNDRTFHSTLTYEIWVELDSGIQKTINITKEIKVNVKENT